MQFRPDGGVPDLCRECPDWFRGWHAQGGTGLQIKLRSMSRTCDGAVTDRTVRQWLPVVRAHVFNDKVFITDSDDKTGKIVNDNRLTITGLKFLGTNHAFHENLL